MEFKLKKFESEKDVEEFMKEIFSKNMDKICNTYFYRTLKDGYLLNSIPKSINTAEKEGSVLNTKNFSNTKSYEKNIEFSKTNIQKQNVDEPDIIKLNKNYIFYYSKRNKKIYIIKSFYWNNFDLSKADIIQIINVPKIINKVNLFMNNGKLIVIWSRITETYFWRYKTDILIFDISKLPKIKLIKFIDIYWKYFDARLIWSKLYVISDYKFNK